MSAKQFILNRVQCKKMSRENIFLKVSTKKCIQKNFHQEMYPNMVIYQRQVLPLRKPKLSTIAILLHEVRNSQVAKSSYETKLRKMTSHFELLTRYFLQKDFFQVTHSKVNFHFSTFELLTRRWKMKSFTSSY